MHLKKCFPLPATLLLLILTPSLLSAAGYAVARIPTPVFSRAESAAEFATTPTRGDTFDTCGQMRALEFVALPGTVFTIQANLIKGGTSLLTVTTAEYPASTAKKYYIDERLVELSATKPPERARHLPPREKILAALVAAEGSMYVWGGNVRRGIPELLALNPPQPDYRVSQETVERWQLRGVDCSGLLYEATGGWTPRNTADLITFGTPVAVAGRTVEEISRRVAPLDLIAWQGHVLIVLDEKRVIQSRLACGKRSGVIITPLRETLARLMRRRVPVDDYRDTVPAGKQKFVIRRWFEK